MKNLLAGGLLAGLMTAIAVSLVYVGLRPRAKRNDDKQRVAVFVKRQFNSVKHFGMQLVHTESKVNAA